MNTVLIAAGPRVFRELSAKMAGRRFTLVPAVTLQEALARSDLASANILLLDLDVPAPNGPSAVARVLKLYPSLSMVGITERSDLATFAIDAHLSTLAEKPLDYKSLIARLEALVAHRPGSTDFCYVPRRAAHSHPVPCLPAIPPRPCAGVFAGWGLNE